MKPTDPIVFIVDDDPAIRESLQWLLESEGFGVETYASAETFLNAYDPNQPGCLVLDIRMRGMSGLELQAKLARESCALPVIMITGHGDIPMAVRAVKAGVVDFLEKPVPDEVLVRQIRHALDLGERMRGVLQQRGETAARVASLTPREREVMDLVVAGKANKKIAADLGITEKTVEAHRKRVMQKMGARSAVELVRLVMASENPDEQPSLH